MNNFCFFNKYLWIYRFLIYWIFIFNWFRNILIFINSTLLFSFLNDIGICNRSSLLNWLFLFCCSIDYKNYYSNDDYCGHSSLNLSFQKYIKLLVMLLRSGKSKCAALCRLWALGCSSFDFAEALAFRLSFFVLSLSVVSVF